MSLQLPTSGDKLSASFVGNNLRDRWTPQKQEIINVPQTPYWRISTDGNEVFVKIGFVYFREKEIPYNGPIPPADGIVNTGLPFNPNGYVFVHLTKDDYGAVNGWEFTDSNQTDEEEPYFFRIGGQDGITAAGKLEGGAIFLGGLGDWTVYKKDDINPGELRQRDPRITPSQNNPDGSIVIMRILPITIEGGYIKWDENA